LVHIGLDEELGMGVTAVDHEVLKDWKEKPWTRRVRKSHGRHTQEHKYWISEYRTTDAWHNVPSRWFTTQQEHPEEEFDNPEDARHFLHEAPQSVQNLFDALLAEGVVEGPRIHESIFLRAWYVHHLHSPQCFQYRVIEINGHWRHWHNDIISAWRDRVRPEEEAIYDIVHPNPPRRAPPQGFMFDIILSQGLEAPRRAGLVTILQRDDRAQRANYAVAASLPEIVSGYQIVQSAEYTHECNVHQCIIRHARERLPYTMAPVHDMQDGDSFTVAVHTRADSSGGHPETTPDPQAEVSHERNDSMPDGGEQHDQDPDPEEQSQVPSPSLASTSDIRAGVHIHRLGHPQTFGRPRWDTAEHVLHDVAMILQVPFHHLTHCHHVQVPPADTAEHEDSIIVQHINDIPVGSTEKLILVDVETHAQQSSVTWPRAPAVSRQVFKVVPVLVRRHLLHLTHTAAYCDWSPQECLVFCNHELWHLHEQGPRRITHGMYFKIIVPPPPNRQWEISHAIRVFHEALNLFDSPEATRIAEHILNENRPWPPEEVPPHRQCKGTEIHRDIDVPMMFAPGVPMRRLRPRHDGEETWFWELGQLFADQAEVEVIEGDAYLYIQTWYIDHDRHPICRRPRPMRLESPSITWIDDFRHEWRDLLDPSTDFSIHMVRPRPPQYRHHNYACHILLEQHRHRGLAAGVLTAMIAHPDRDAIIQSAFSTTRHVRQQDLIDLMAIEHICTGRRCTAYHDQEPIHLVVATEVRSGFSIRINVGPADMQLPVLPGGQGYFDDIVLMQRPRSESAPTTTDRPTSIAACDPFVFNPNAAVFHPGEISLQDTSEFVQDLHAIWIVNARSWDRETPMVTFLTWFVDHRQHYPHCLAARSVALTHQFTTWEREVQRVWRDVWDEQLSHELHVVIPTPPDLERGIAGHILVVQAPHETWVTSLVTIYDSFLGRAMDYMMRVAVTTDERIYLEQVVSHCGYELVEGRLNPNVPCRAWIDGHPLQSGHPWPGRSGHEITLRIDRQTVRLADVMHDEHALLQLPHNLGLTQGRTQISLEELLPSDLHDSSDSLQSQYASGVGHTSGSH